MKKMIKRHDNMKVIIDSKEQDRIRPAMFYFSINNNVSVQELETGDYIFEEMVKKQYLSIKQCQIS